MPGFIRDNCNQYKNRVEASFGTIPSKGHPTVIRQPMKMSSAGHKKCAPAGFDL